MTPDELWSTFDDLVKRYHEYEQYCVDYIDEEEEQ